MVIDSIRAKIARAHRHIGEFKVGVADFYSTKPLRVAVREDANRGKRIYYVEKIVEVPHALTAIAADIIQNLRSPLDHIAYQLVLASRGGAKPDWPVYYPIAGSAADYPPARIGRMKGIGQEVIDAIDATEPYPGGKGRALWQLNELNKPDKHELLIAAGAINTGVDIAVDFNQMFQDMEIPADWPPEVRAAYSTPPKIGPLFIKPATFAPLNVGDELYIEPLDKKAVRERSFTFDVALNVPGVVEMAPALKTLQELASLVDEIVTRLGRLLP